MINKQYEIIKKLKETLRSAYKVGIYPDDVSKIGTNIPAVMISDENEVYDTKSGGRIEYHWRVGLYVYTRNSKRLENALDVQNDIMDKILNDQTLQGTAVMIYPIEIEKGIWQEQVNWYEVGIYRNLDIRKIILEVVIYDER